MTTLNTIIEEEKTKLDLLHKDRTSIPSRQEQHNILTTAMQRAYEAGEREADAKWEREVEGMKNERWVEHGRDCVEGRRPCGAVEHPEPLADRCQEQYFDKHTLDTLLSKIRS